MRKKIRLGISILFLVLSIISYILYLQGSDRKVYSDELINSESRIFKNNLNSFLAIAKNNMKISRQNLLSDSTTVLTHKQLNKIFTSQIKDNKLVKGVLLLANDINYALIKQDNTWTTTFSNQKNDSLLDWSRLDNKLNVISQWSDTYNFFLDSTNRLIVSRITDSTGLTFWRAVESEIPDKKELLIEISGFENSKGKNYSLGLIYKTTDISNSFSSVLSFQNPMVYLINEDGNLITPIVSTDSTLLASNDLIKKDVEKLITTWLNDTVRASKTFSFEKANQVFWTRVDTVNQYGIKGFSITVSDNDINRSVSFLASKYLYAAIFLFVMSVLFIIFWYFRKQTSISVFQSIERHSREQVERLIKNGETATVEYKSSLRYDYREQKENKILENVILKSISAFANAKGGTLLIGVDDDMNILGLENDFSTLKKQTADYFELHLNRLITNQFGISFVNEHLLIYFEEFENKTICIVQINPASSPTFLKLKEKNGGLVEKFYVRSGNSSHQISSLKEIQDYIKRRFRNN